MKSNKEILLDRFKEKKLNEFNKPENFDTEIIPQFGEGNMSYSYYKSLLDLIKNKKDLSEGNIGISSYEPIKGKYITESSNTWSMPEGDKITNPNNRIQRIFNYNNNDLSKIEPMLHGERLADMRARDNLIQYLRKEKNNPYKPEVNHRNDNLRRSASLAKINYDNMWKKEKNVHENEQYALQSKFSQQNKNPHIKFKKTNFSMPEYNVLEPQEKELYRVQAYNDPEYLNAFKGNEYFKNGRILSERPFCQDKNRLNCRDFFNSLGSDKTYLDPKSNNNHKIQFGHLVDNKSNNLDQDLEDYRISKLSLLKEKLDPTPLVTKAKGGQVNTAKLQKLLLQLREMMA